MNYLSWHNLHMLAWIAFVGAISFTISYLGAISFTISYLLVRNMKLS